MWAASGGSLSGTLTDSSGSVLPGAKITLTNAAMKSEFKTTTDGKGYYSFPNLAVGHYDLKIEASGFGSQRKTDVTIDADASVKVDVTMQVMTSSEEVTVTAESSAVATQVETSHSVRRSRRQHADSSDPSQWPQLYGSAFHPAGR
jgi:hypothetical protein